MADLLPRVVYLHGFASSARSTKATWFGRRFEECGVPFVCPDFNEPEFRTLTMTRMLAQLETILAVGPPAVLMGSSLGGTLAVLTAERVPDRVSRLVLMAPAVMFAKPGHHLLPPERVEEWRQNGALPFFHYGFNAPRLLDVAFYEDTIGYDAFHARVSQPTLIFQGRHDAAVDYRTVEQFAKARANVTLSLLDDDHQLTASLEKMWEGIVTFLDTNS